MSHSSPAPWDFHGRVRDLRASGMADESIARQVVDDAFRAGVDLRLKQSTIEQLVRAVPSCR